MEKSVPVPLRPTVCVTTVDGEPPLLSVIVSVALRGPVIDGVNVTEMVQLALGARVAGLIGQLLLVLNSGSLLTMLKMIRGAVPVFESMKLRGALVVPIGTPPNTRLLPADKPNRLPIGAVAVPVRLTNCVLGTPLLLSENVRVALRVPGGRDADGVKVTVTIQLEVTARVLGEIGQLLV